MWRCGQFTKFTKLCEGALITDAASKVRFYRGSTPKYSTQKELLLANTHGFSIHSAHSGPWPTGVFLHFLLPMHCWVVPCCGEDGSIRILVHPQRGKPPQFLLDFTHYRISCNKGLLLWGGGGRGRYRPIQTTATKRLVTLLLLLCF